MLLLKVAGYASHETLLPVKKNQAINMQTGIKQLDNLISKHGISAKPTHNAFQSSLRIFCDDPRLDNLHLPYCMWRVAQELSENETVMLHRFYLAYNDKSPRLAFFMVRDDGSIIEKVFFLRQQRYQAASKAITSCLRHLMPSESIAA